MKRVIRVFFLLFFGMSFAQQNVFHRDNANTGDWGSGNLPWFYQTSNNSQGDPDNGNNTRNDVFIGHNNNTTMSLNGRFYIHRDFTFQSGASSARTLNNTAGGGFSFSRSLINASTATHIFNTPVGIDGNNSEIILSNATGGNLTFNGSVFTNNNLVFLRNSNGNTGTITFNGAVPQGGSFVKQNGGTVNFTASADFSGSIFIDEGTVRVGRNLASNVIEIGGGLAASSPLNAILEIENGGTTISKSITVKNFNNTGGNRNINFTHPSSTSATISGAVALERTVTITNPNTNNGAVVSNTISGIGGITKAGTGLLLISSGSVTYSGLTTVSAGELRFNPSANLTLSTPFRLENGAVFATTGVATNRTITSSGSNATLQLNSGTATLALAAVSHSLTFANSSSVSWAGTTLTISGWNGSAGQAGTVGRIFFGNNTTGLTVAQLNKINFSGFPSGAQLLSTGELVPRCENPTNGGTIDGNQSICAGSDPAAFTSITIPSGQTGTIEYKWQFSTTSSSAGFSDILGATTNVYDAPAGITQTTWFKRLAKVTCQTDWTNAAESNVVEITIASTSWTAANGGSWTNGAPTATTAAIIEYDFTSIANLIACSLTVSNNAAVIISSGNSVTLNASLVVNTGSTFTLEHNANLVQNETTNTNSGEIIIQRETSSLMRLDYVIWSSPVANQNLLDFSPDTFANRFYTYSTLNDNYSAIVPSSNDFEVGKGYLIRMPDNHPTTATLWSGTFNGVPNNGTISAAISDAGQGFNAVGNPYPSPITISDFLTDNTASITSDLYFWRKTNNAAGSAYVTYSGGVFSDASNTSDQIQSGQGFIVKATTGATAIEFNNLQRTTDNGLFYRTTLSDGVSRMWIGLANEQNEVGSMVIGYKDEATNGYDADFDGLYINDSPLALVSLVDTAELIIQHRAPFEDSDVVPLLFKTNTAGNYTISITGLAGLFDSTNQAIYLKDNLNNTITNLKTASYAFASEAGVFASRFEIVYQAPLSVVNPVFGNGVVVYSKNQEININTGAEAMATVKVIDVRGRLLTEKNNVNAMTTTIPLAQVANQVLIVQITAANGQIVSRKVVH